MIYWMIWMKHDETPSCAGSEKPSPGLSQSHGVFWKPWWHHSSVHLVFFTYRFMIYIYRYIYIYTYTYIHIHTYIYIHVIYNILQPQFIGAWKITTPTIVTSTVLPWIEAHGISMDAFCLTVQLSSYARARPRQRERMEERGAAAPGKIRFASGESAKSPGKLGFRGFHGHGGTSK